MSNQNNPWPAVFVIAMVIAMLCLTAITITYLITT